MSTVVAHDAAKGSLTRPVARHWIVLSLVGGFGGAAHDLPEHLYVGGLGGFDLLVMVLLLRWVAQPRPKIERRALKLMVPFYLFAVFAYIGEIVGAMHFDLTSWSSIIAPLRFITYPTLFVTLPPLLSSAGQLRTLFLGYIAGVLVLSLLAVFRSTDPGFFFGLPVLFDPNVVGNFISYAMIALGFAFMPKGLLLRGALLSALFGFALFTFSKATWLLSCVGIYINAVRVRLWKVSVAVLGLVGVSFLFVDWQQVFTLVSTAIDMKTTAAVGNDATGGSLYMRYSFMMTSMYSLYEHPLGVGLKNFLELNHTYAHVHEQYFDSESPHMAFGYVMVQAGWAGLVLLGIIYHRVLGALFELYDSPPLIVKTCLVVMITISILFMIEILTQPFIYLVLAAALARSNRIPADDPRQSVDGLRARMAASVPTL